jgi:hypothetical protein
VTDRHPSLPPALDAELDEALSLVPLVDVVPDLADRVFHRVTDCLVEALLHDARARIDEGDPDRAAHLTELCRLVVVLAEQGLRARPDPPPRGRR